MPGFLSPGRGLPLLLIPEYSGVNKEQGIHDRSKTAHKKSPVKCFLTGTLWVSWTWVAISFPIFGKFSTLSPQVFSHGLSFCLLLGLL